MPFTLTAMLTVLCELIARHGHRRRLAGPLVVRVWNRVSRAGQQVEALMARLRAGTLRRHRLRRQPRAAPRRKRGPSALPRRKGWLIALLPETAVSACHLRLALDHPDLPALLAAAPQLRRSLRPLCHMLDVRLPPPEPPPNPSPVPPRRAPHIAAMGAPVPAPSPAIPAPPARAAVTSAA